eukprot:GHVT01022882.1.p2 GENE.GHVT01022882.1~~GHVT01022882.1.p2  ORF type:complete len:101 (+),score=7.05 GHVT01022882.1:489-791(+)
MSLNQIMTEKEAYRGRKGLECSRRRRPTNYHVNDAENEAAFYICHCQRLSAVYLVSPNPPSIIFYFVSHTPPRLFSIIWNIFLIVYSGFPQSFFSGRPRR